MFENGRRRLTSWKEIAAYVARDVRTVLRWEKERGLPVHRPPGATGRVVLAYTDELDAWLHGAVANPAAPAESAAPIALSVTPSITDAEIPRQTIWRRPWTLAAASAVILAGSVAAFVAWPGSRSPIHLEVTETSIVARGDDGSEKWQYRQPDQKLIPVSNRHEQPGDVVGDGDLIVGTSYTTRTIDGIPRGGELIRFTRDGRVRNTFAFDDRLQFGDGPYTGPWTITDYRALSLPGGHFRVAVAAHHFEWWPSVITILDDRWQRSATFVNAGWVERVHWVAPDRLLIAGFSNDLDGGMAALLDTNALDGQSPVHDQRFACATCGRAVPLRYVVFPRSEVNLASGARFNRAVMTVKQDGIVIRTIEKPADANAPDALYELSPSLELRRATYSDRYWEAHRELEAAGRITHTQSHCPDRNGPREIRVWEPETGWNTQTRPQVR
jgi:hypothetical protein